MRCTSRSRPNSSVDGAGIGQLDPSLLILVRTSHFFRQAEESVCQRGRDREARSGVAVLISRPQFLQILAATRTDMVEGGAC